MGSPSIRDVKRLFALSGNRCAYPKCSVAIADGSSLVGEICHIKGDKPNAARFDASQTNEHRQAFGNLILMCGVHHKVVDDDEEAYTVQRLTKMKADHESGSTPLHDDSSETEVVAQLLIQHSVMVSGQSGSLAAHTVNAQTINIHAASPDNSRASEGVDILWRSVVAMKAKFNLVAFVDQIMLPSELNQYFGGDTELYCIADCLAELRDTFYVSREMTGILPKNAETHRLHVTPRLWAIYQAFVGLVARSAMLITLSFKDRQLHEWRKDDLIEQHLRSVLPGPVVEAQKSSELAGLQRFLILLDEAFLEEAKKMQD